MSSPRQPEHQQLSGFRQGLVTGPIVSLSTYVIDRLTFGRQTCKDFKIFNINALTSVNPSGTPFFNYTIYKGLPGLIPHLGQNIIRYSIIGATKPIIKNMILETDPSCKSADALATAAAGGTAVFATAPISVAKALRYSGQSSDAISKLKFKTFFTGMPATGARDAVFFGTYVKILPTVSQKLHEVGIDNQAIAGGGAGVVASIAGNPFAVVANTQKAAGSSAKNISKTIVQLSKEGGVKRFLSGASLSCPGMFFRGVGIAIAHKTYTDYLLPENGQKFKK